MIGNVWRGPKMSSLSSGFFHVFLHSSFIDNSDHFIFISNKIFPVLVWYMEYWEIVCDIRCKNSTMVIIFHAVLISINNINESANILGHSGGSIDNWYGRIGMHNIKEFFSGWMLILFNEVKIKVTHTVTRVPGNLLQTNMHCVVKVQNVAIWRTIYSSY